MFLNRLTFQRKLMVIFTGMALLPTVVLVLVAYRLISGSIERWANNRIASMLQNYSSMARDARTLAYELSLHDYLPLTEAAQLLAVDYELVAALEQEAMPLVQQRAAELPEFYSQYVTGINECIVALYDPAGVRIFSTDDDLPPAQLSEFSPALDELTDEPTLYPELEKRGLLGCGMPVFAEEDPQRRVGVVVVAKLVTLTPSQMRERWSAIQSRLGTLETDIDEAGTEYRRTERRNTSIALMITAVVVILLAFWASRSLARSINTPIQTLIASTKQIADGNLNHKVDVQTNDEFAILAYAFNRMVVQLRNRTEELKRAEQIAAWQDIAQKLAHEIKNPLTPIQLSAQRLHRRYHRNPEGFAELLEQCTQTIVTEVDGLRRLLDEFSQLAQMPAPNLAPIDLRETVESTLTLIGELPPQLACRVEIPPDLPRVVGDTEHLKRAFLNLAQNALDAMSGMPKGTLTIRAFQIGDRSKVFVRFSDTGHGISPDIRLKLFMPHFSTKKEGKGLGLAIVKKIMTDLGGDIHIEAPAPNQTGTTFTLWLNVA
jgi:nitrogen fixation/metabolism regulation signal transduction histidine kinase